jgi:secreted trypsin-like serine protease
MMSMRQSLIFAAAVAAGLSIAQIDYALAQTTPPPQTVQGALRELAPSFNLRILGGVAAAEGAWPWQVVMQIPIIKDGKKGVLMCGGSLVASQWVLTAAHCFEPEPPASVDRSEAILVVERAPAGSKRAFSDLDPKALHRVALPIRHPNYNRNTSENDIALLHLRDPARSKPVRMLLLPNPQFENAPTRATVTGWGVLRGDVEQLNDGTYLSLETREKVRREDVLPDRLMQVEMQLVAAGECKARNSSPPNNHYIVDDRRNLCAGVPEGGKDSCQGDSGGPLMVDTGGGSWIQIGIVSWGVDRCGLAGFPGVYTRLSAFADWIRTVMGRDLAVTADELASQQALKPAPPPDNDLKPNPAIDNTAGVTINFDKGDAVSVGDRVAYRVTTLREGYLAIFDATPDGKLIQVFPNARSIASPAGNRPEAACVSPQRPLLIPNYDNPYRGFDVVIEEPRGKGTMVAVLSDAPIKSLDIPARPKTFGSQEEALAAIKRLRQELSRNLAVTANTPPNPKWSVGVREYTIR